MAVASKVVRAAGGIVSRRNGRGELEVLLVHRGKQRDWAFPKGRRDRKESDEDCALREVREETGLRCALVAELPVVSYRDHRGRDRRVRYWAMTVVKGEAEPRHEIDAVRWLDVDGALSLLTQPRDRALLRSFAELTEPAAR
jgi:8-oxo-dGTP diphosphatase